MPISNSPLIYMQIKVLSAFIAEMDCEGYADQIFQHFNRGV